VQGDRRIPNAPERVLDHVHPSNVITVRASVHRPWLVTGGADRAVRVHDLQTGAQLHTFLHHRAGVLAVDLHPLDPNLLLTASMDGTHHLLDLSRPSGDAVRQSWKDHTKFVVRIQCMPLLPRCKYDVWEEWDGPLSCLPIVPWISATRVAQRRVLCDGVVRPHSVRLRPAGGRQLRAAPPLSLCRHSGGPDVHARLGERSVYGTERQLSALRPAERHGTHAV